MQTSTFAAALAAGALVLGVAASGPAGATDPLAPVAAGNPNFILAADGCGWNGWRGPGGACHYHRGFWRGRYWGPGPYRHGPYWNGRRCPPGFWVGPHGHCRR